MPMPKVIHRVARLEAPTSLAQRRQVRVIVSDESLGRDGLVVVTSGIDLTNFRRNPVILWQHDPSEPIACAASISVAGDRLEALVQFPPAGVCRRSDEALGLIQNSVVNSCSIGFDPLEMMPIDPSKPFGDMKILESELQEISFVSVPALASALVLERSRRGRGRARTLTVRHQRMAKLFAAEIAASPARRSKTKPRTTAAQRWANAAKYQRELSRAPAASRRSGLAGFRATAARFQRELDLRR